MNVWIIYTFCPPPIIAWYYNPDYFCLTITNILLNAMNTSTFAKTIVSHWSVIAVVAVLIYYSIFSHEFQLYWDDQWQVINSMTNDGITLKNLQTIFHSISNGQYSPINQLYYTLIHRDHHPTACALSAWYRTASELKLLRHRSKSESTQGIQLLRRCK